MGMDALPLSARLSSTSPARCEPEATCTTALARSQKAEGCGK